MEQTDVVTFFNSVKKLAEELEGLLDREREKYSPYCEDEKEWELFNKLISLSYDMHSAITESGVVSEVE